MFLFCNKNPDKKVTKNNAVSAVAVLFCLSWKTAKSILEYIGNTNKEEYDSLATIDLFLRINEYVPHSLYCGERARKKNNVKEFVKEHTEGDYMLLLNDHVVPAIDGVYYDYYDSGKEAVIMYWRRN